MSRQPDLFVAAANYLQSLDWRSNPEIMKNIIAFYTKAKAMDSLALFYDSCAQVEIEEYQNYEKALGALRESYKYMSKAKGKEAKSAEIKKKIAYIEQFVSIKQQLGPNPAEALRLADELLARADIEVSSLHLLAVQVAYWWYSRRE